MKRLFSCFMLIAAVVAMVATGCQNDKQSSPTKADAAITVYVDVNQIIEKSGITDLERSLIASQLTKEIRNYNDAEFIAAAIADFNNSGIDFNSPIFATLDVTDEDTTELVIIAKVSDVEKLDRLAEIVLQYIPNTNIETRGSTRYFVTTYNMLPVIGYNESYLALAMAENGNSRQLLDRVLKGYEVDAEVFNNLDAGVAMDLNKVSGAVNIILDMAIQRVQMLAEIYAGDDFEGNFDARITALNNAKSSLKTITERFEENASLVAGIEFKNGEAVLSVEFDGIKQDGLANTRPVNNSYIANLPADLLAVANINIDGKAVANIIEQYKEEIAASLNMGGVIPYVDIAIDAIKSLDGDTTLAVNNIEFHKEYDWYFDSYDYKLDSFNFDVYATVCDRYIFDNVVNLPGVNNYLTPVGNDIFTLDFSGMNIFFGQSGNTLYLGSNNTNEALLNNATTSSWYSRVGNGSYGYLVLNIKQLFESVLKEQMIETFTKQGKNNTLAVVHNFFDKLDYAAINVPQSNKIEVVVAFNDRTTNALKQIVATIKELALAANNID